jgi:hypothetical protein
VYAGLGCGLENRAQFVGNEAVAARLAFEAAGELAPALLDMLAAAQQPGFHSKAQLQRHLALALGHLAALLQACQEELQAQERALQGRAARHRRRATRHLQLSGSDSEGCSCCDSDSDDGDEAPQTPVRADLLRALLGPSLAQAPPQRGAAAGGQRPPTGWWALWGLLGSGSQVLGPTAASAELLEAAVRVLGLLLEMRLLQHVPSGCEVPAQLLATLARLLRDASPRLEPPESCICGSCRDCRALEVVNGAVRCLRALASRDPDLRLAALENVLVLPFVTSLLGDLALPELALDLLEALACGQPEAQQLAIAQPGLLQGLAAVLRGGDRAAVVRVARVLRLVTQDNACTQQAVVNDADSGVVAALVELLGARSELANEAAEVLAVLQQGGAEAREAVRAAARGLTVELG